MPRRPVRLIQRLSCLRRVIPVTLLLVTRPATAQVIQVPRPLLVVVITIDQFRGDYLQRWSGQWTGGFRLLLREGAVFPHGQQDHAVTETAPGHATILSGRSPASTGIVLNSLGVPDPDAPLVGDARGSGASPRRFRGSTLVDWMQARDSRSQFLSVSQKDRGAILPIGRSRGPVFWYADGRFTTSRYYADVLPAWLTAWTARNPLTHLEGREWPLLLPDSAYPEPDSEPWEHGHTDLTFPHHLPTDSSRLVLALPESPWMDSLTLDVALEGSAALQLGQQNRLDLLAVSLSATDHIGHGWGPDSRELHDHLLRLDRWLGAFFDALAGQVPRSQTLIVLTGDHGVTPFPERTLAEGGSAGRIPLGKVVAALNHELRDQAGTDHLLSESSGLVYLDTLALPGTGLTRSGLSRIVAERLRALPGVAGVWTPETLPRASGSDPNVQRWRNSLPADFPWVACASARPEYIWADDDGWTTHGTTNPEDVSVPIVLLGPGVRWGIFSDTVRTIDIAPTLARLLGVPPSERPEGRPVLRLLAHP